MGIWLTNFSDFIQKVFGVGKQKIPQLDFGASLSTYEKIIESTSQHRNTVNVCVTVMQYLPDIYKNDLTPENKKSMIESLAIVRGLYQRSKKESDDILYWLNHYMKECKNGKASEEEGPEAQGQGTT